MGVTRNNCARFVLGAAQLPVVTGWPGELLICSKSSARGLPPQYKFVAQNYLWPTSLVYGPCRGRRKLSEMSPAGGVSTGVEWLPAVPEQEQGTANRCTLQTARTARSCRVNNGHL